jgi:CBS domain-containing protein
MDQETIIASEGCQSACPGTDCSDIDQLKAKDVMRYGVISIDRKEPLNEAVSLLLDRNISGLAVTDQGRLCGILSEKDLLKLMTKTEYLPGLVEDYMTREVTSFDVEDPLTLLCERLIEGPFRRAPVLHQQRLAGMISRRDVVGAYKERFRPPENDSAWVDCSKVPAEEVMTHGLLAVRPTTSLYDTMDMIVRRHVTGLPVVDGVMYLVGIVTEKDLLRYITHPAPASATAGAIMTTKVVTFDRKATLDEICTCLIENDFHRVPILDHGRLVGIVSRSDILRKRATVLRLGMGRSEDAGPRRPAHAGC